MIWKTNNGLGQEVVWYSEDEYNTLLDEYNTLLISLFVIQELLELYNNGKHIDRVLNRIDEGEKWKLSKKLKKNLKYTNK